MSVNCLFKIEHNVKAERGRATTRLSLPAIDNSICKIAIKELSTSPSQLSPEKIRWSLGDKLLLRPFLWIPIRVEIAGVNVASERTILVNKRSAMKRLNCSEEEIKSKFQELMLSQGAAKESVIKQRTERVSQLFYTLFNFCRNLSKAEQTVNSRKSDLLNFEKVVNYVDSSKEISWQDKMTAASALHKLTTWVHARNATASFDKTLKEVVPCFILAYGKTIKEEDKLFEAALILYKASSSASYYFPENIHALLISALLVRKTDSQEFIRDKVEMLKELVKEIQLKTHFDSDKALRVLEPAIYQLKEKQLQNSNVLEIKKAILSAIPPGSLENEELFPYSDIVKLILPYYNGKYEEARRAVLSAHEFAHLRTPHGEIIELYKEGNSYRVFLLQNHAKRQKDKVLGKGSFSRAMYCKDLKTGDKFCRLAVKHELFPNLIKKIQTEGVLEAIAISAHYIGKNGKPKQAIITPVCDSDLKVADIGSWTLEERKEGALTLLKALAFMHSQGVAHNDLKPENILVKRDPKTGKHKLMIADFDGISAISSKVCHGTRHYLAPEALWLLQMKDRSFLKDLRKKDVYEMGHVLLFLFEKELSRANSPILDLVDINEELQEEPIYSDRKVLFCECAPQAADPSIAHFIWKVMSFHEEARPTSEEAVADFQQMYV